MARDPRPIFRLDDMVALVTGASHGIGEAMARELARFGAKVLVRSRKQEAVDAVAAAVRTRFSEALWKGKETLDRFVNRIPLGRIGEPEDISGLAVYLASGASAYCTGGICMVDGGYAAN